MTDRKYDGFADVLDELICAGQIARGSWPKGMRLAIDDKSGVVSVLGRPPGPHPWTPRGDDLAARDWIIVTDREDLNDAA